MHMPLLEGASDETKQAMSDLLDVFTGADGGGSFVKFSQLIVQLDKQATEGDAAAKQLIRMFRGFGRLAAGR